MLIKKLNDVVKAGIFIFAKNKVKL